MNAHAFGQMLDRAGRWCERNPRAGKLLALCILLPGGIIAAILFALCIYVVTAVAAIGAMRARIDRRRAHRRFGRAFDEYFHGRIPFEQWAAEFDGFEKFVEDQGDPFPDERAAVTKDFSGSLIVTGPSRSTR